VVGWKLTLIVQLALAATEGRQLLLCVQPLEIVKLLMLSATVPVFVTVTGWGGLVVPTSWWLKLRLVGETLGAGRRTPVPLSGTVWGLLASLSLTERLADSEPTIVGVNVTLMVQLVPAASAADVEQVVPTAAMAKSPVTLPVMAMLEIVRLALPLFESVTGWAGLVVPTI
jgi:hypothetical protein